jgi:hypothetical protein
MKIRMTRFESCGIESTHPLRLNAHILRSQSHHLIFRIYLPTSQQPIS